MPTIRYTIQGRVQGVGYRMWAQDAARELGLNGYVANRPDGSVELVAAGPDAALERLLYRLRQGPPAAQVSTITTHPADDVPAADGFRIER